MGQVTWGRKISRSIKEINEENSNKKKDKSLDDKIKDVKDKIMEDCENGG